MPRISLSLLPVLFVLLVVQVFALSSDIEDDDTDELRSSCSANETYGFGCEVKCETDGEYLDCGHEQEAGCVCNQGYCRTYSKENGKGEKMECQKNVHKAWCEKSYKIYENYDDRYCEGIRLCTKEGCYEYEPPGGWPSPRPFEEPTKPPIEFGEPAKCGEHEVFGTGCEVACLQYIDRYRWDCAGDKPRCMCGYGRCRPTWGSTCRASAPIRFCTSIMPIRMLPEQCWDRSVPGGWPSPRPVANQTIDQLPTDEPES